MNLTPSSTSSNPRYCTLLALSALVALAASGGGSDDESSAEALADKDRRKQALKRAIGLTEDPAVRDLLARLLTD